jgi:hypothetical protein
VETPWTSVLLDADSRLVEVDLDADPFLPFLIVEIAQNQDSYCQNGDDYLKPISIHLPPPQLLTGRQPSQNGGSNFLPER